MKRFVSLVMSVIIGGSAVAGILPAAAEELPAPYAWMETADGTLQMSDGVTVTPCGENGNTDVVAVGDTGEYGILLKSDWSGFSIEGDVLANVPAGESAVLAIGYYIDSAIRAAFFRYQIGSGPYVDVDTTGYGLASCEAGVLLIPLSAEEVATWRAEGTSRLTLLACPLGGERVYLQSVRVVATAYTAIPDVGCVYAETDEQVVCRYLPHISDRPSRGMVTHELEKSEDIPERPWLYRYYAVQGEWLASEDCADRPVYIKIYAAEGYENDTIRIDSIERDAGEWGAGVTVQMTDGAGGVYVPYTNFTNGLNAAGSFRFWWTEAEKVARVELYDVTTYCTAAAADETRIAWLHDRMRAERVGITVEGYRAPTADEVGYSGDICCAACGALVGYGVEIPRNAASDLPAPYVRMETVTGVTWVSDGVMMQAQGEYGSDRTVAIGDTGKCGVRLEHDWSGFTLMGEAFRTLPADAVLAIEYYLDTKTGEQMFRYKIGDMPQVDLFSTADRLVHGQTGVLLRTLSPDEIARLQAGEPLQILACPEGAGVTYVQSVQVIAGQYAAGATGGNDRVALVAVPLCAYYPDAMGTYNHGMPWADVREGYDAAGELRRYTYFATTKAQAAPDAKTSPVVIRLTFEEDHTITEMTLDYQCARPQTLVDEHVWASRTVAVTDKVVEVFLEEACFTNGLYGAGSFRVPNTTAQPVADQLVAVEVFAVTRRETLREKIDHADETAAEKTPASVADFMAVVREVTAVCEDPWATPDEIAEAEARLVAAAACLVPCPHRYIDNYDTTCEDCGATRTPVTTVAGDVNGDEKIDSTDARLTLQYAVKKIGAASLDAAAADADGNGRVDSTDARLILQYAVKKIDTFPTA